MKLHGILLVFWSAVMNIECENLSVFVHYLPCSHGLILEAKKFRCEHACSNMFDVCFQGQMYSGGPCCFAAVPTILKELVPALACRIGSV